MLNELPDVKVVLTATSFESAMLKKACPHVIFSMSACGIGTPRAWRRR